MFIVYSAQGCGGCALLKRLLKEKEVDYKLATDFEKVIELGLSQLPILEVDGKYYSGSSAIEYVKNM